MLEVLVDILPLVLIAAIGYFAGRHDEAKRSEPSETLADPFGQSNYERYVELVREDYYAAPYRHRASCAQCGKVWTDEAEEAAIKLIARKIQKNELDAWDVRMNHVCPHGLNPVETYRVEPTTPDAA